MKPTKNAYTSFFWIYLFQVLDYQQCHLIGQFYNFSVVCTSNQTTHKIIPMSVPPGGFIQPKNGMNEIAANKNYNDLGFTKLSKEIETFEEELRKCNHRHCGLMI